MDIKKNKYIKFIINILPIIVLIFISCFIYLLGINKFSKGNFQVYQEDPAEYRFIAEQFWGVKHDYNTYSIDYKNYLGIFHSKIPFRQIGVGTYYLIMQSFSRLVFIDYPINTKVIPYSLVILFCITYIFFYFTIKNKYNTIIAIITTSLLIFPPWSWVLTKYLLSEPFLRILFVFSTSLIIQYNDKKEKLFFCFILFILLILFCVQIKVQWVLLIIFLFPFIFIRWFIDKLSIYKLLLLMLFSLIIPFSLITINFIGWKDFSLTRGSSIHIIHKTNGKALQYALNKKGNDKNWIFYPDPTSIDFSQFWGINFRSKMTLNDVKELDRLCHEYILKNPLNILKEIQDGLKRASNFPFFYKLNINNLIIKIFYYIFLIIDIFVWIILILGLTNKQTLILSALALSLWIIPAIGNIFDHYEFRHNEPMAGLVLSIAVIIIYKLITKPKEN